MNFLVYKFINEDDKIIYIGKTKNLKNRMEYQHFTSAGNLSENCYDEVVAIFYAETKSQIDMDLYERYLISKHTPKYNKANNVGGVSIALSDLEWERYEKERPEREKLVGILISEKQKKTPQYSKIINLKNNLDVLRGGLEKCCRKHVPCMPEDCYEDGDFYYPCLNIIAGHHMDEGCDYDCDTCSNCEWAWKKRLNHK